MNTDAKIARLELDSFTAFEAIDLTFSKGVNVIIGANSTGKTHLMKLMFSILKANEDFQKEQAITHEIKQRKLAETLIDVFKPDQLNRLVHRSRGVSSANIKLTLEGLNNDDTTYNFGFSSRSKSKVDIKAAPDMQGVSCLYLPPVELLSVFPGFLSSYLNRETAYDRTFFEAALALDALPARGPKLQEAKQLLAPIEKALGLKVSLNNGRFYLKFDGGGNIEAPLAAEGIKKLGMLLHLVGNGSLGKNSILFWDEPEAHLNPRYIRIVVDFLKVLAEQGVQIFLATHDYLLSQRLSLAAEGSGTNTSESYQFISLYQNEEKILADSATSMAGLSHNPILDEFLAYTQEEEAAFYS
jgi:energy-coupling factor transporter ATP-binding protein EcfA2